MECGRPAYLPKLADRGVELPHMSADTSMQGGIIRIEGTGVPLSSWRIKIANKKKKILGGGGEVASWDITRSIATVDSRYS